MVDHAQVKEHAPVVSSDGKHVGTVDHVEGEQIKLTRNDEAAGGQHHIIPFAWVGAVEGDEVILTKTFNEALRDWQAAG